MPKIPAVTAEAPYCRTMRKSGSISMLICQKRAKGTEMRSYLCSWVIAAASSGGRAFFSGPHRPNGFVVR
jgi:hypothetical protein